MKDFLKQELEIGDFVVLIAPAYRHLVLGKIDRMTPQYCVISYSNTWNFGPNGFKQELRQKPEQLVKIDKSKIDIV